MEVQRIILDLPCVPRGESSCGRLYAAGLANLCNNVVLHSILVSALNHVEGDLSCNGFQLSIV